ncbi:MAG: hypothetical protein Q4D30_02685, partial [Bacteroidales bacterium]|nr:hypothetical protein [Bacteroidales bacterium]
STYPSGWVNSQFSIFNFQSFCACAQTQLLVHTEKIALARCRKKCSSNNTTKIQNQRGSGKFFGNSFSTYFKRHDTV